MCTNIYYHFAYDSFRDQTKRTMGGLRIPNLWVYYDQGEDTPVMRCSYGSMR